jgi:hypothetical protein
LELSPARRELAWLRQRTVAALRERFERAVRERDLPRGADCAALSRYVATVLNGAALQTASGATEAELEWVAAAAMRAWPT